MNQRQQYMFDGFKAVPEWEHYMFHRDGRLVSLISGRVTTGGKRHYSLWGIAVTRSWLYYEVFGIYK
jgi:hypothetical protein